MLLPLKFLDEITYSCLCAPVTKVLENRVKEDGPHYTADYAEMQLHTNS